MTKIKPVFCLPRKFLHLGLDDNTPVLVSLHIKVAERQTPRNPTPPENLAPLNAVGSNIEWLTPNCYGSVAANTE
jgi:hypothetical protein